jgi:WD40 repeat protein
MTFTPDGQTLISGSADGVVKLWDPSTGQERGSWQVQEKAGFSCLACSPDGRTMATGSCHRTVKTWDLNTRQELSSFQEQAGVYALAFTDGGKSLVVGNGIGMVTVWDFTKRKPTEALESGEAPILSVSATPDSRRIISGSLGGIANFWNLEVSRTPTVLEKDGMFIQAVALSADGSKLAYVSNMDYSVRIWEEAPAGESR